MASHTSSPEARSRATTKFVKEKLDRIEIRFTKESGMKQIITEHAQKNGENVTSFITRAIKQTMESDNKKTQ
jgi:uncharacterized protein (DUF1778 family)